MVHGKTGPVLTSLPGNASILDSRVLQTTSELTEFPFNLDMNSGNPLGVGWLQSTIGHGVRSSAATAFLTQDTLDRQNLDVLIGTRVTRLLQTGRKKGKPTFLGVELAQSISGACILTGHAVQAASSSPLRRIRDAGDNQGSEGGHSLRR